MEGGGVFVHKKLVGLLNSDVMPKVLRGLQRRRCSGRRGFSGAVASVKEPVIGKPSSATKANPDGKLASLRRCFKTAGGIGIDAYVIPSEDPHQSEFIADCFMRRAYISGFTGSAGTAVVTKDKAALWTDGRYFLQARKQLGPEWQLMRAGLPGVPTYSEWLQDILPQGSKVGIDPFLFSSQAAAELKHSLLKNDHELIALEDMNLVDRVWGECRPSLPSAPLRVHDIKYAGVGVATKLENLRRDLLKVGASAMVVTMLDEVAWLLNLRGNDVPHSPVFYAYVIVEPSIATLFVDESKITVEVSSHLKYFGVEIKAYEALLPELERDAAAITEFWDWLEKQIASEEAALTEVEVAETLLKFRSKQIGFLDTSFDTICGSGANGAIIHYRAEPERSSVLNNQKLFLLDSGGQYVDGTTDITRTVHFGMPTARQKECFTRVLQGHIAIDKAIFPEDTPGFVLDVLARSSLWKIGLDYRHGTGHGVGAALNVHEGPQSISARYGNMTGLKAGMIVSDEPGYYEDGAFGIRIENLLAVCEVKTANNFGGITYLGFERLTMVPFQKKLMDVNLMSKEEIEWVNSYHEEVWEKVSPLVGGGALEWLQANTSPIVRTTAI